MGFLVRTENITPQNAKESPWVIPFSVTTFKTPRLCPSHTVSGHRQITFLSPQSLLGI